MVLVPGGRQGAPTKTGLDNSRVLTGGDLRGENDAFVLAGRGPGSMSGS